MLPEVDLFGTSSARGTHTPSKMGEINIAATDSGNLDLDQNIIRVLDLWDWSVLEGHGFDGLEDEAGVLWQVSRLQRRARSADVYIPRQLVSSCCQSVK